MAAISDSRLIEIYVLKCPETGVPKYVGQSVSAKKRFKWHTQAARRGVKGRIYNWLRSIQADPVLEILETCQALEADRQESFWITKHLKEGYPLTNCTLGGGGIRGLFHSEDTKQKIGNTHRGKVVSPETRQRISQAKCGLKLTEGQKAKFGQRRHRGPVTRSEKDTASSRMRGNALNTGRKQSLAHKRKKALRFVGEKSSQAKLTDAEAQEVRDKAAQGVSYSQLAFKYGVSKVCIHRIVRWKTYKKRKNFEVSLHTLHGRN